MHAQPLNTTDPNDLIHSENAIIEALRQSIRCVLRLFGGRVHMRAFMEVVKQEAVREAQRQLQQQQPKRKIKRSELNMKLGLDSRVISRIQNEPDDIPRRDICPEAALLARWARDPSYHNTVNDEPMVLSMYGASYSFSGLVSQYFGRGVSAPMVAKRLASQGCVYINPKGWIQLKKPDWVWIEKDESRLLQEACCALNAHTNTLIHNMQAAKNGEDKWLDRRLHSLRVPPENAQEARKLINSKLIEQKNELSALMAELEDQSGSTTIMGAGYYYWEEESKPD
ncbi:MAG: DUF6502 family protein [Xanthomonadales bacterium]|nr:DUF6502 family protein [Xanthomonadales bacterium]